MPYLHGYKILFQMKKIFISLFLFLLLVSPLYALPKDSIVMTVAGHPVSLDEFLFIAHKNTNVDLSDKNSIDNFVTLFKNFKLKVAEAEEKGYDKSDSFKTELSNYQKDLESDFLCNKEDEEKAALKEYNRKEEMIEFQHILFFLPKKTVSIDTISVYNLAKQTYKRILAGEDIKKIGNELTKDHKGKVVYNHIRNFNPFMSNKVFEDKVYSMHTGEIAAPFRSALGFHLVKVLKRFPNPGFVKTAHILIKVPSDRLGGEKEALKKAEKISQLAHSGSNFKTLAKQYSEDNETKNKGGELPFTSIGQLVPAFEKVAFSLDDIGAISAPVKTEFGYHIIKLLAQKNLPTFKEDKEKILSYMKRNEYNFDVYDSFDQQMLKEYNYKPYPKAYVELQTLCNENFPSSATFQAQAATMNKVLFHLDGKDFKQKDFAYYMKKNPFSTKTYATDYMDEIYKLYLRAICKAAEKRDLNIKHPEYKLLLKEYRDGLLLFYISNKTVWNKPMEQQAKVDSTWIKALNKKYDVQLNHELIKTISEQSRK